MQAEQAHQKAQLPGGFPAWRPDRVRALVGVSGVYNCFDLADHFNTRGLYRKLFDNIMSVNGKPNLKLFSPTYCIKVGAQICDGLSHCIAARISSLSTAACCWKQAAGNKLQLGGMCSHKGVFSQILYAFAAIAHAQTGMHAAAQAHGTFLTCLRRA